MGEIVVLILSVVLIALALTWVLSERARQRNRLSAAIERVNDMGATHGPRAVRAIHEGQDDRIARLLAYIEGLERTIQAPVMMVQGGERHYQDVIAGLRAECGITDADLDRAAERDDPSDADRQTPA